MAAIYFSDLARKTVIQVPILPATMPENTVSSKNEEFETFDNGVFNFLNQSGLVTFSLDSFLPEFADKYSWAKSQIDPYTLINLWRGAMQDRTPLRCIMQRRKTSPHPEIMNWMVTVEQMAWHEDSVHDVKYKVDFKEYRSVI